jgi:hypothetical protein
MVTAAQETLRRLKVPDSRALDHSVHYSREASMEGKSPAFESLCPLASFAPGLLLVRRLPPDFARGPAVFCKMAC